MLCTQVLLTLTIYQRRLNRFALNDFKNGNFRTKFYVINVCFLNRSGVSLMDNCWVGLHMFSRLKTRMLIVTAVVTLSAGVYSVDYNEEVASSTCSCSTNTVQVNSSAFEQCKLEAHTSWYAWLTGRSSSAQFHYLDLLELLLGSDDSESSADSFTSRF